MALADLWVTSRGQLEDKHVQQVIAFAGTGRLRDGAVASEEFREFLSCVPSTFLARYANECLGSKFDDGGFALQDVVNEIGGRLGFQVRFGRYRGLAGQFNYDGLWESA